MFDVSNRVPFLLLVDIAEGSAPDNQRILDGWPLSHPQLISMQSTVDQNNQGKASNSY